MSERETQNSKIIDGRTSARLGPDRRGGGVTHGGVAGAGRGAEYLAEDVLLNQQVRTSILRLGTSQSVSLLYPSYSMLIRQPIEAVGLHLSTYFNSIYGMKILSVVLRANVTNG